VRNGRQRRGCGARISGRERRREGTPAAGVETDACP
jgi:hypothetical protein